MKHEIAACLACVIAALSTAAPVEAAPVLPKVAPLNGDVQSLAGIERVRMQIVLDSKLKTLKNYSAQKLTLKFESLLEESGLTITETDFDAPLLRIAIQTQTASDLPEAVAVIYHVSLTQVVMIERTGKKVKLPTYSLIHATLIPEARLEDELDRPAERLVNRLIGEIRRATEAMAAVSDNGD